MKHLLIALLAFFALAAPALGQTFPQNNGSPVVDQAGILTSAQIVDLTSKAQALYASSGRAFAVATVKSLEGHDPNEYAYQLLRYWKLGSAKNNDGVLLLVAPTEHKVAISTGYGAGEYMTDAMSGIIIRENILPHFLPHFKQTPPDFGGGIEAGADAIIKQMSLPPDEAQKNVTQAQQQQSARQHSGGSPLPVVFWAIVIGFILLSNLRRAGGRRYRGRGGGGISPWVMLWGLNQLGRGGGGGWGGGSWGGGGGGFGGGGGGFGGFGGGSGGGGGASGSW